MSDARKNASELTRSPDYLAHGIENAFYAGGPGDPYYQPVMECMCGWRTRRCESWEDAGRLFDAHLAEAVK